MILDLFAGPGGWSEGLKALGRSDIGIELDRDACRTRAAAGHATIRADVATYPSSVFAGKLEGLIASPPCQSMSMAGKGAGRDDIEAICAIAYGTTAAEHAVIEDPRAALVLEPLWWTLECRPEWVAWEQVPPVLPIWQACAHRLREYGYSVSVFLAHAEEYGVPQTRTRAILMGHRRRIVTPPAPTHQRYVPGVPAQRQDGLFGTLEPWVSMAESLGWDEAWAVKLQRGAGMIERHGDRPERQATSPAPTVRSGSIGGNLVVDRRTNSKDGRGGMAPTAVMSMDGPAPTLTGKAGGQWVLRHGNQEHSAERDVATPASPLVFGHALNDVSWVERRPATTVMGDPRVAQPGHTGNGEKLRSMTNAIRLSIEGASILQSFRADYPWQGPKTSRFGQIGNAIPPLLAKAILAILI